jgi:hypothetical protein
MKNKYFTIILVSIIILMTFGSLFIPRWINSSYFDGLNLSNPNTMFSAGEQLLYWGSVLTFIGTSILAIASLIQNNRLHKRNIEIEKENKNIQLIIAQEYIPFLRVDNFIKIKSGKANKELPSCNCITSSKFPDGKVLYSINLTSSQVDQDDIYCTTFKFHLLSKNRAIVSALELISVTIERNIEQNVWKSDEEIFITDTILPLGITYLNTTTNYFELNIYCSNQYSKKDFFSIQLLLESTIITGIIYREVINIQLLNDIFIPRYQIIPKTD